jgi:hypothetical protein
MRSVLDIAFLILMMTWVGVVMTQGFLVMTGIVDVPSIHVLVGGAMVVAGLVAWHVVVGIVLADDE